MAVRLREPPPAEKLVRRRGSEAAQVGESFVDDCLHFGERGSPGSEDFGRLFFTQRLSHKLGNGSPGVRFAQLVESGDDNVGESRPDLIDLEGRPLLGNSRLVRDLKTRSRRIRTLAQPPTPLP